MSTHTIIAFAVPETDVGRIEPVCSAKGWALNQAWSDDDLLELLATTPDAVVAVAQRALPSMSAVIDLAAALVVICAGNVTRTTESRVNRGDAILAASVRGDADALGLAVQRAAQRLTNAKLASAARASLVSGHGAVGMSAPQIPEVGYRGIIGEAIRRLAIARRVIIDRDVMATLAEAIDANGSFHNASERSRATAYRRISAAKTAFGCASLEEIRDLLWSDDSVMADLLRRT